MTCTKSFPNAAPPPSLSTGRQTRRNRGRQRVCNNAFSGFLYRRRRRLPVRFDPPRHFGQPVQRAGRVGRHLRLAIEDLVVQIMQATDYAWQTRSSLIPQSFIAPAQIFDANRILYPIPQNNTANNAIQRHPRRRWACSPGIVTNNYFYLGGELVHPHGLPYGMQFMGATSLFRHRQRVRHQERQRPCCTCASALIGPTGADFMDVSACKSSQSN